MRASLPRRLSAAMTRAGNTVGDELFPVLVWLTVFGATRLAPSLILRLSIAVPQSMDFPPLLRWRRTSSRSGLTADELSARLADTINNSPSRSSDSGSGGGTGGAGAALLSGTSHRIAESLFSLLTYPQRLLTYVLFQRTQRAALQASDTVHRNRPVAVRLLLRLVTSFTATWVHASGHMLYDTLVTYLSTRMSTWSSGGAAGFVLGNGGPGQNTSSVRLSSGWRDLLVASCVSTGINLLLQTFWLEAMTNVGELRTLGRRPASPVADGDAANGFTHTALSTLLRLGRKDTLFRLGRMALRSPEPAHTPPTAASSPTPPPPAVSTPAASAHGPARAPQPARVFLCGGNAFVFALSGFRFAFYADFQQLTTSAANCLTDALDLLLRQANQRAAAQRYHGSSGATAMGEGHTWRPPVSLQAQGLASSSDVVLSPASSMQLLPIYVANFVVGAGAGLLWREQRLVIAAGRKIPLVRNVLEVLLPLPPPPLRLPEALQELSPECHILLIYVSGATEVVGEDRAAPLVKRDGAVETTNATAAASASPSVQGPQDGGAAYYADAPPPSSALPVCVRARIVVAQDLFCPIKRTLMCDPVQTVDDFTYDRDGIEQWLRAHDTAPLTNLHLESVAVRVNWAARRQVEELMAQYAAATEMR
ncbi:hypothetical protein ABB37_01912 [Leptomonas pyrrhocoris]|uniref:U-box domain-containing protein n=1 Tax=Leptomonas pyrrhocoris TaxID=157538 RepID=A0A0N0VGT1_LEPPY|nr:hypothetical protein ABB37_01912 [Leptomonas pyrrhocoris]KPA83644.1 hypothetical protein ABB37_01912 [Leptomonas pyrrhocoris]|eukprot:XP_015662083.1 hypothetical protein ABB37_01912 [Leptomonas pyrrhocoris]